LIAARTAMAVSAANSLEKSPRGLTLAAIKVHMETWSRDCRAALRRGKSMQEDESALARLLTEALDAVETELDRLVPPDADEAELAASAENATGGLADALAKLHAAARRAAS
jgi:DNA-binding transcriptional MerR regulator